jgi:predicted nucleic acid-binding protein
MSRRWVVNASPLILLGKVGHITLFRDLSDELVIPEAVVREIGAKSEGERVLAEIASLSGVHVEAEIPISADLAAWSR